jgi:hypothetical protein
MACADIETRAEIHHDPAMSEPKRKRAPGGGRKRTGITRTASLPKIRPESYAELKAIAAAREDTVAGALEWAIQAGTDQVRKDHK